MSNKHAQQILTGLIGGLAGLFLSFAPLQAAQFKLLHAFGVTSGDGQNPKAGLVQDSSGNLYGTTYLGGNIACQNTQTCGVVFKIAPDGTETVFYAFCSQPDCTDGSNPESQLILDASGNLYGTTLTGGGTIYGDGGTVFKIAPDGTETVLYTFCAVEFCPDGLAPGAGVTMDSSDNLYGTTQSGGVYGYGNVFELSPKGKIKNLYSFCADQNACTDGFEPNSGLLLDSQGNLYGTTVFGGLNDCGTQSCGVAFKLSRKGTEKTLYQFCSQANCADGGQPQSALVEDGSGNLYGTAERFGKYNGGVVFKLSPKGKETIVYDFCRSGGTCPNGNGPLAGLIADQKGNFYGTTYAGGKNNEGTVFEITASGKEVVLHSFAGSDGEGPWGALTMDANGNLYGTTYHGGTDNDGTVFKVTP